MWSMVILSIGETETVVALGCAESYQVFDPEFRHCPKPRIQNVVSRFILLDHGL
jgi:hypothetical protein